MLITAENASELGKRGVEARRRKKLALQNAPLNIAPTGPEAESEAEAAKRSYAREYQEHLIRLRTQLTKTRDPWRVDKICAAIARLEDVYCRYANIPQPGSRKPAADKPASKRGTFVEPA